MRSVSRLNAAGIVSAAVFFLGRRADGGIFRGGLGGKGFIKSIHLSRAVSLNFSFRGAPCVD